MIQTSLSRRRFGAALALSALPACWVPLPSRAGEPAPRLRERSALMGTQVDLVLGPHPLADADAAEAWRDALAEMRRLEAMMSRYRDDNPLAALARAAGREAVPVPPELMAVLQRAQALSQDSAGAFDATVGALQAWHFDDPAAPLPAAATLRRERALVGHSGLWLDPAGGHARLARAGMRLDLGGVAKLPILQAGLRVLLARGLPNVLLNGGGDVLVRSAPGAVPWRIGLRDAARPDRLLAVLPLREGVVASSGDYERGFVRDGRRYHHVLDPATGQPSTGVHGVSLVADTVETVNGLGAAAMVLGPLRGPAWLQARAPQSLLVRADGSLWCSAALAARLLPPPGQDRVRA